MDLRRNCARFLDGRIRHSQAEQTSTHSLIGTPYVYTMYDVLVTEYGVPRWTLDWGGCQSLPCGPVT